MRCVVTGADGFMGSHLVDALVGRRDVEHVTALVHRPVVRWVPEDMPDRVTVVQGNVQRSVHMNRLPDADVVFHMAALASPRLCDNRPEEARLTNFQGTVNLLNRCLEMPRRPTIVFPSSAALYGEPQYLPIDEAHPVEPRDAYTYSKISAEITLHSYLKDQGVPSVIVRPFNIYGPRQGEDYVVPTIVSQVLLGIELRLGDGRPVRNFTYVTDAVDLFVRAALYPDAVGRTINLGSRHAVSVSAVVESVLSKTGSPLEPIYDQAKFREGDPTILEMDPSLAEDLLGWRPRVPLDHGLDLTIEHFRGQLMRAQAQSAEDLYSSY